ncbi:hypothetical protein PLESTB_000218700 [Pleodorina starrii]|uniref:Uncharacterized protein n=1 Tax=Pleodorina starrii TaxID=330485 RepID=A0A9W6BCX3_9CHLO|nr:hypothetical protein PLESTM_001544400 [Pleodorina starrii]GLC49433.1 hypothetical protein PLESTB_000218700 [Pleodorina starrii]GLC75666.1 hypothetical protein PLESTF_001671700 [Pleodorina starrii]
MTKGPDAPSAPRLLGPSEPAAATEPSVHLPLPPRLPEPPARHPTSSATPSTSASESCTPPSTSSRTEPSTAGPASPSHSPSSEPPSTCSRSPHSHVHGRPEQPSSSGATADGTHRKQQPRMKKQLPNSGDHPASIAQQHQQQGNAGPVPAAPAHPPPPAAGRSAAGPSTGTGFCLGSSFRRVRDVHSALGALASQPVELLDSLGVLYTLFSALLNGLFIVQAFVTRPRQHGYWDNSLLQLLVIWTEFLLWFGFAAQVLISCAGVACYRRHCKAPDSSSLAAHGLFVNLRRLGRYLGLASSFSALGFLKLLAPGHALSMMRLLKSQLRWTTSSSGEGAASSPKEMKIDLQQMGLGLGCSFRLGGAAVLIWQCLSTLAYSVAYVSASVFFAGLGAVSLYVKVSQLGDVISVPPGSWRWGQWFRFGQFLLNVVGLTGAPPSRDVANFLFSGPDNCMSREERKAMAECERHVVVVSYWRAGVWAALVKQGVVWQQKNLSSAFIYDEEAAQ